jgi:hypothetical protein
MIYVAEKCCLGIFNQTCIHSSPLPFIVCFYINPHKTIMWQFYYMFCSFWSIVPLQKHMVTSSDSPNIWRNLWFHSTSCTMSLVRSNFNIPLSGFVTKILYALSHLLVIVQSLPSLILPDLITGIVLNAWGFLLHSFCSLFCHPCCQRP